MIEKILKELDKCKQFEEYSTGKACVRVEDVEKVLSSYAGEGKSRFTGLIRCVDDLGRIMIPKEIRKNSRIQEGTPMEILVEGDAIILKKYCPGREMMEIIESLDVAADYADCKPENKEAIKMRIDEIKALLG